MEKAPSLPETKITRRDLFWIFLKSGLAFGGGLGILAILEDELVSKREAVSREEFLAIYGLGRIVPSGTMTALAVAYGWKFGGWIGTVITLTALALPAFVLTVLLTMAYGFFQHGPYLDWIKITVIPAALGFIILAAVKLGKEVWKPSIDLVIATAAFAGAFLLDINPSWLLLGGGILGIFAFRYFSKPKETA